MRLYQRVRMARSSPEGTGKGRSTGGGEEKKRDRMQQRKEVVESNHSLSYAGVKVEKKNWVKLEGEGKGGGC